MPITCDHCGCEIYRDRELEIWRHSDTAGTIRCHPEIDPIYDSDGSEEDFGWSRSDLFHYLLAMSREEAAPEVAPCYSCYWAAGPSGYPDLGDEGFPMSFVLGHFTTNPADPTDAMRLLCGHTTI